MNKIKFHVRFPKKPILCIEVSSDSYSGFALGRERLADILHVFSNIERETTHVIMQNQDYTLTVCSADSLDSLSGISREKFTTPEKIPSRITLRGRGKTIEDLQEIIYMAEGLEPYEDILPFKEEINKNFSYVYINALAEEAINKSPEGGVWSNYEFAPAEFDSFEGFFEDDDDCDDDEEVDADGCEDCGFKKSGDCSEDDEDDFINKIFYWDCSNCGKTFEGRPCTATTVEEVENTMLFCPLCGKNDGMEPLFSHEKTKKPETIKYDFYFRTPFEGECLGTAKMPVDADINPKTTDAPNPENLFMPPHVEKVIADVMRGRYILPESVKDMFRFPKLLYPKPIPVAEYTKIGMAIAQEGIYRCGSCHGSFRLDHCGVTNGYDLKINHCPKCGIKLKHTESYWSSIASDDDDDDDEDDDYDDGRGRV